MAYGPLPTFASLPGGGVSCHGTAVSFEGKALLLTGSSGAGKSGTAAQMIAMGAQLICDDLAILRPHADQLVVHRPPEGSPALELRGLGIVKMAVAAPTPLAAVLVFGPLTARLPEAECVEVCGQNVPVLRHPVQADLAAKLMIWLGLGRAGRTD